MTVYYGATPNGLIKIGYTEQDPYDRAMEIARRHPGFVLLAARPGGLSDERRTHAMFMHLRVLLGNEREWYRAAPELLTHLMTVARGDYLPDDSAGALPIGGEVLDF